MSASARILVVEDAVDLLAELVDFLRFSGFDAHGVDSIAALQARWRDGPWHGVLLDLGLPDGEGLTVARELRLRHGLALGIVIMTARGHVDDRVAGLRSGADCYLTKPVDLRELKAVIDGLLPRVHQAGAQWTDDRAAPGAPADCWRLDRAALRLVCPGGATLSLTGTEARLIGLLFEADGEVLRRDSLCKALGPGGYVEDTRRLDTLVSRLRSKVEREAGAVLPIQTFRNLGYAFGGRVAPERRAAAALARLP